MRRTLLSLQRNVLIALALTVPALVHAQRPLERLFYYVECPDPYDSFVKTVARMSVLAPSAYSVDDPGVVWGEVEFANWRAGYDIKALAEAGDFISVMTCSEAPMTAPGRSRP